nr:MAG TPA: hypothetical protein [Caudoviricetes sp.]
MYTERLLRGYNTETFAKGIKAHNKTERGVVGLVRGCGMNGT